MTNYERLLQEQMKDPEFAKAYRESQMERIFSESMQEQPFKVRTFNLGQEVHVDREELYSEKEQ